MNEQIPTDVQQRVLALYRYTNAMDRGDGEAISAVLEEAQQDPALERMVLELNEIYRVEDGAGIQGNELAQAQEMLRSIFALPAAEEPASVEMREEAEPRPAEIKRPVSAAPTVVRTPVRRPTRKWRQSRVATLVAAVLLALLIVPVFSAFAPQFLALFRPQQFTAVKTDAFRDPIQVANNLNSFLRFLGDDTRQYATRTPGSSTLSRSKAQQEVHFPLQLPTALPAGTGQVLQYTSTPADQEEFTFDAAKTRAYLQKSGQTGISVPSQLDGATFKVSVDAGMLIAYYQQCAETSGKLQCSGGTPFIVTEVPDPTLQAESSASLNSLRDFLLSLPRLPTEVRTVLQHVDIQNGVVPVPLPQGASSSQVSVQGSSALLVTLSNNSGIIWEARNIVYIILAAHSSPSQIQASAESMQ